MTRLTESFREPEHHATKARSSFFSLSAELRNVIYDMVLSDHIGTRRGFICNFCWEKIDGPLSRWPMRVNSTRPALLAVNKQVRQEAMSLYYAQPICADLSAEDFDQCSRGEHAIATYLDLIGPAQATMIKAINLTIDIPGELEDPQVIDNILENNELLDKGVPRDAWSVVSGAYCQEETNGTGW